MLTFNDFIRAQSLVELPMKGRSFSWSNMQQDLLLVQLDWHFTSINWASKYPNTMVLPLGKPVSDHSSCYVCIQTRIPKAKIFRFEEFWTSAPGFFETVDRAWNRPHFAANSAKLLCKKLKCLRYDLKKWSKGISHLSTMISNSNQVLQDLDLLEDRRPLSIPERNFWLILKKHLITLLDRRKCYWKKCCTVRYFKFGDGNTKFFHRVATERYRRNSIATLTHPDGSIVSDHVGKEALLYQTYKDRLGTSNEVDIVLDLHRLIKRVHGFGALSSPFSHAKIDEVVRNMPADRAPGPDGFSGSFLKSCWHIIKCDFYKLCEDFHA